MDDSSFLITGANGQLGRALKAKYTNAIAADKEVLDITNKKLLNEYNWDQIKVIINAAAFTKVDEAELSDGKKQAWAVNSIGVANLANIAINKDITIIHFSTEYIFDGTKSPHLEDELASPICVYGKSKAAGEQYVFSVPKHYLIRTSWMIGDGKNFVRTMIDLGKKGVSPKVVDDQIGRLTFTDELVRAIDHLLSINAPYGVYNVTNEGQPVSWATVASNIFSAAGYHQTIMRVTSEEYFADKSHYAKRPLQSTLSLDKIEATGFKPVDWQVDLRKYIDKELIK